MSNKMNVLFVEDQIDDCNLLIKELQQAGYDLEWKRVETSQALIDALENQSWDIVLSDYAMPDFSGLVALKVFKKFELDIPFIFVSGVMGERTAVKAMKMGAADYVMKASLRRLVPAIERELKDAAIRRKEKIAQKALEESDKRWRELFDNIRDGWVSTDLTGYITGCNVAYKSMLGYTQKELVGLRYEDLTPVQWHEHEQKIVDEKIMKHGYSGIYEKEYIHKSGRVFPVELSSYLRKDEQGNSIGFWAIVRDISPRKKMENELKSSVEKAEEVSRLKSCLLLNISHELRTPMNGILGFASFLKDRQTEPENVEMADFIISSGKRLMATLNSILDLATLQSDRTKLELTEIKLTSAINQLMMNFSDIARKKNVLLNFCAENDITAVLDLSLLNNIIHHLLDNALKFTSSGSVTASVVKEVHNGRNTALIRIADTGIGIMESQKKIIFEPFRQASEGLGRKFEGSGLGLTLCRQFAELMNGEISVKSKPGEGSTFMLRFPLASVEGSRRHADEKRKPVIRASEKETWPEETAHVLIVEDNPLNSELTARFIQDAVKVDQASDGFEALNLARSKVYDAVLMDIHLSSEMDGLSATAELRKLPGYDKIPVIAITGYSTLEQKEKIFEAGLTHCIVKPFDRKTIRDVLKKALSESA